MISNISYLNLFSIFLENLEFDANIKPVPNGYRAKKGNTTFRLIRSSNTIVLKEKVATYDGYDGYTADEKLYIYKITQSDADVKILDENGRSVLKITAEHAVVRVTKEKKEEGSVPVFIGSKELLQYREAQKDATHPTLF